MEKSDHWIKQATEDRTLKNSAFNLTTMYTVQYSIIAESIQ